MAKRKKIPRKSGIRERVIYRDSFGRFATRDDSVSEEWWKYRVDDRGTIQDLKIEALPFRLENTEWYRSIQIPEEGQRAGKISAVLKKTIKEIGFTRADVKIEVTMKARTYHGRKVSRKLVFHHYNTRKLEEHTIGGIINELFYKHGDRPAYPLKVVKGWRKREVTKKETERRRQLHDVTFSIKTEQVSRKAKPKRKGGKK